MLTNTDATLTSEFHHLGKDMLLKPTYDHLSKTSTKRHTKTIGLSTDPLDTTERRSLHTTLVYYTHPFTKTKAGNALAGKQTAYGQKKIKIAMDMLPTIDHLSARHPNYFKGLQCFFCSQTQESI